MSKNVESEEMRRAVLEVLATRAPAAFPLSGVQRRIALGKLVDGTPSEGELEAALEFLRGLDLVEFKHDGLGSSKYWNATSKGVLAFERGI